MIKKFAVLLSLAVAMSVVAVNGQTQKVEKAEAATGILFRISGKSITKPSYIFGTFHILCPADMLPLTKFDPYIDQADQVVMEIDMDDSTEMQSMTKSIVSADGKSIKDVLTAEQYTKVDDMFKNALGLSVDNLKTLKPTLLSVAIITSPKMLGCSPPSSYDLSLVKTAQAKSKPIFGLETVAFQSQALDTKPFEKQAKDLYEMSLDPQKSVNDLKKLIEAYKEQDVEKLRKVAAESSDSDAEFDKHLIDDRNAAWIPKIEGFIKEKPTFIAVGAGHLGGKNGVIALLRAKGYQVTPIRL